VNSLLMLRASSGLWLFWGIVHVLFGVLIVRGDVSFAITAIANGIESVASSYPDALGAIINQHGWNLIWFGAVTIVAPIYIWRGNFGAAWMAATVGGLADLGYFLFLDLGGYVKFFPGTLMTIVALSAIVLTVGARFGRATEVQRE